MPISIEGTAVNKGLIRLRAQWFKCGCVEISNAIRHITRLERTQARGKSILPDQQLIDLLKQVDRFCRDAEDADRYTRNPLSRRIEMLLGEKRKKVKK